MWMQDVELQELTGSEPLTLKEEYEMQKLWLEDEKKCTFIVLDKEAFLKTKDEVESMIGDVNLFFNDQDDDRNAEIEVMIAETGHRGKGKGKEALLFMLRYGVETLDVKKFVAKIKMKNAISQKMFQSIKFMEVKQIPVFQEVVLECEVNNAWKSELFEITHLYQVASSLPVL